MSVLGELLEAMHGARALLGPVQGTVREWRNERLVHWLSPDHWPDEEEENRRWSGEDEFEQLIDFKLALPDRVRVETRWPHTTPNSIVVCDGTRSATWIGDWGTTVEDLDLGRVGWILGTAGRLLDPAWLLGLLEFDSLRPVTFSQRPAFRARGRPRSPLPWPFGPADEHELVVDRHRGTVFRLTGLLRGSEAFVHELVELEHDATFDDETFALAASGDVSGLGLREAANLVGFGIWALPRPVLDVTYRPEPVESVTLTYDDAILVLTPASIRQGTAWLGEPEAIERGGRTYWLSQHELTFAAGDALIRLWHATALGEELLDLAETLVLVPD